MKNILATSSKNWALPRLTPTALVLAISMAASALLGAWATHKLFELDHRQVVTVRLSRVIGDFIEAEARAGRPPEESQARVAAYVKAVEASVQSLARDDRTVLVAEAVVAGSAPDLTNEVRADVARCMGALSHDVR